MEAQQAEVQNTLLINQERAQLGRPKKGRAQKTNTEKVEAQKGVPNRWFVIADLRSSQYSSTRRQITGVSFKSSMNLQMPIGMIGAAMASRRAKSASCPKRQ